MIDFEKIREANKNSEDVLNFDIVMSNIVHDDKLESLLQEECEYAAKYNNNEVKICIRFITVSNWNVNVIMYIEGRNSSDTTFKLCSKPVVFNNINNINRGLAILMEALHDMGFKKIKIVDNKNKTEYNSVGDIGNITSEQFFHMGNMYTVIYTIEFDI
jgi:hypothetical protein